MLPCFYFDAPRHGPLPTPGNEAALRLASVYLFSVKRPNAVLHSTRARDMYRRYPHNVFQLGEYTGL